MISEHRQAVLLTVDSILHLSSFLRSLCYLPLPELVTSVDGFDRIRGYRRPFDQYPSIELRVVAGLEYAPIEEYIKRRFGREGSVRLQLLMVLVSNDTIGRKRAA